jgi:predicted amidophosphoribosyltransferase
LISWSEFSYSDWGETLLRHYKEKSYPEVMSEIIPSLRMPIKQHEVDALVYVASDPVSNRRRFFDPSHELARQLSKSWGVPFVSHVFRRIPQLFSQKELSREQRRFWASRLVSIRREKLEGVERVLLVDDLLTTGETLRAHMGLLSALGLEVKSWTLFRKF